MMRECVFLAYMSVPPHAVQWYTQIVELAYAPGTRVRAHIIRSGLLAWNDDDDGGIFCAKIHRLSLRVGVRAVRCGVAKFTPLPPLPSQNANI